MAERLNELALPPDLGAEWTELVEDWRGGGKVRRLWERDASLWTSSGEQNWLGWLEGVDRSLQEVDALEQFSREIREAGFQHILLLGMGGSSLCPETLSLVFGDQLEGPRLRILDSTDPAQLLAVEDAIDLRQTLFCVSSKSGSTLEPDIMRRYFFEKARAEFGDKAGERFIAVTDPGSALAEQAKQDGYRRVFLGVPEIGGRYSAISNFGMAPAAAAGLDVREFLERTKVMADACRNDDPEKNPGVALGLALGLLARRGRDKLTFAAAPPYDPLGAWLEQLVAESTGKQGKAIIPVDLEPLGPPESYGPDRVLVEIAAPQEHGSSKELIALESAGHPLIRTVCLDPLNLGQEFFRWEIATAVAGAVLELNPFDQPDVEASKKATKQLTSEYEKTGKLPAEEPFYEDKRVALYAAGGYGASFGRVSSVAEALRSHLRSLDRGDYFALLAYIEMNERHIEALQRIRRRVRDARRTATCLGFGPRFLHSTGQAYKGGPNSGVFLQITCEDARDAEIPGKEYTFGVVKAAQARGDFEVLTERDRRALRLHIKGDPASGLAALDDSVRQALA